jgi:hypothetical protein
MKGSVNCHDLKCCLLLAAGTTHACPESTIPANPASWFTMGNGMINDLDDDAQVASWMGLAIVEI